MKPPESLSHLLKTGISHAVSTPREKRMRQVHLQLTDQLHEQAKQLAVEAGFASLDEYILDLVSEDVTPEPENFDHLFTPKVLAHLDQIQNEIKAGAKTYSEAELDEFLQERARAWRESHVD